MIIFLLKKEKIKKFETLIQKILVIKIEKGDIYIINKSRARMNGIFFKKIFSRGECYL